MHTPVWNRVRGELWMLNRLARKDLLRRVLAIGDVYSVYTKRYRSHCALCEDNLDRYIVFCLKERPKTPTQRLFE